MGLYYRIPWTGSSAPVRSATVTSSGAPGNTYTLAWYYGQLLIDTIRDLSPPPYTSQNPQGTDKAQEKLEHIHGQAHEMTAALIKMNLRSRGEKGEKKKALLEALSAAILEKIGYHEKEAAVKWWYQYRPAPISSLMMTGKGGKGGNNSKNH
ncbi:hypothetical protein BYT27DRAFT_7219410 [Phlegmacium glaucopus]|nr:hypothetical protein BYT27DRAFT_7219410 [Phlegmacium glaucopus]